MSDGDDVRIFSGTAEALSHGLNDLTINRTTVVVLYQILRNRGRFRSELGT